MITEEYAPDRTIGNGATTVFNFGFKVMLPQHLKVMIADENDENRATLVLDTDYTITGVGEENGGSITVGDLTAYTGSAILPTGWSITRFLELPVVQAVDLHRLGFYSQETHESMFDYITYILAMHKDILNRCVKMTITSGETGGVLEDSLSTTAEQSAASAASASTSAANAATSESNAADSAVLASQWANNPEDTVVTGGLYSALHHAAKAAASALLAEAANAAAHNAINIEVYAGTATASQTVIDVSSTITGLNANKENIQVFIDGARKNTFTRTNDTTITLDSALTGGEIILVYSNTAASVTVTSHSHLMTEITGLTAALNGKADSTHSHEQSDITGLSTALGAKLDSATHTANHAGIINCTSLPTTGQNPNALYRRDATGDGSYSAEGDGYWSYDTTNGKWVQA